jgi:ABC-type multidrug transport system fused ATPase/permease subunit
MGSLEEELKNSKYSSWQLIKDIWSFLKPYKWRFFIASLIRLAGDLAALYPAFALASIVTFLTQYKQGNSL